MSSLRSLRSFLRIKNVSCVSRSNIPAVYLCSRRCETTYAPKFTSSRRKYEYMKEMYYRRMQVGPEEERHPSVYGCWNHDAEIYAFGQRLGEEFDELTLKQAFTSQSYAEEQKKKWDELGLEGENDCEANTELSRQGRESASRFIKVYLRYSYPHMFEEGICAIHDYLMSDTTLLHIAQNLGVRDLIQTPKYPPSEQEHMTTFLAVIGALRQSQSEKEVEKFVADFILSQLIVKDINELWAITNPMGLLVAMLKLEGLGEPEPRLLWSSGQNTIMPLYHVGIYSDKKLIAKSAGESVIIAEEMAARESLKLLMNTTDSRPPLQMGEAINNINFDYSKLNRSVKDVQ